MKKSILRFAVPILWLMILLSPMAEGQPCASNPNCPTDAGNDVLFEIETKWFDWNPFSNARTNFDSNGPAINSVEPVNRVDLLGSQLQETTVSGAVTGNSVTVDLANQASVTARRVDGYNFGNGATVSVRVFVKGPPGTPYYVASSSSGKLTASFPDGAGRADSYLNTFHIDSVNGAGPMERLLGTDLDLDGQIEDQEFELDVLRGVSGAEIISNQGATYTYATTVVFDTRGGVLQSINICFPSCPTVDYSATANAKIAVDAGIGAPPCVGTLRVVQEECLPDITSGGCISLTEPFTVVARFEDEGGATCECCEYQQFVQHIEYYVKADNKLLPTNSPQGGPAPCAQDAGENKGGCCPVEDSVCESSESDCIGELSYGNRNRLPQPPDCHFLLSDGYFDINGLSNQSTGCVYRGLDAPGFPCIKLTADLRTYKYKAEFLGRIISTCPSANSPVIAERRWTVDCGESSFSSSPISQSRAIAPERGQNRSPNSLVSEFLLLDNRNTIVTGRDDGNGTVHGTVTFGVSNNEILSQSDMDIVVAGASNYLFPNELLSQIGSGLGSYWLVPFMAMYVGEVPDTVSITVTLGGVSEIVSLDFGSGCVHPADFDFDCDVDDDDYLEFESCVSGAGAPFSLGCDAKDFDNDADVDLVDFEGFTRCYSGSGAIPLGTCLE